MTATLPQDIQQVFDRFITTEYTTIDRGGPADQLAGHALLLAGRRLHRRHHRPRLPEEGRTTPRPTRRSRCSSRIPRAAASSARRRCSCRAPPRSTTRPRRQPRALRARVDREAARPPSRCTRRSRSSGMLGWYYTRIYVHVRPERVYVWPEGDCTREPELLDAHLEEVRSGPRRGARGAAAGARGRRADLGRAHGRARRSLRDGRPLAGLARRLPVLGRGCRSPSTASARRVRLDAEPVGVPLLPGLACVTAHDHAPDFTWQRNFQVRGDLVEEDGGWVARAAQAGRRLRAAARLDARAATG